MKKLGFIADILAIAVIFTFFTVNCNPKTPNQNEDDYPISDSQYVDEMMRDTASKIPVEIQHHKDSTLLTPVTFNKDGMIISSDSLVIPNKPPKVDVAKMASDMGAVIQYNTNWIVAKDKLYKQIATDESDTTKVNQYWDEMDAAYSRFSKAMKQFKKKYKTYLK